MEEEESLALPALSPRLNWKRTKKMRENRERRERKSIKEKESERQFKYSPTPQL